MNTLGLTTTQPDVFQFEFGGAVNAVSVPFVQDPFWANTDAPLGVFEGNESFAFDEDLALLPTGTDAPLTSPPVSDAPALGEATQAPIAMLEVSADVSVQTTVSPVAQWAPTETVQTPAATSAWTPGEGFGNGGGGGGGNWTPGGWTRPEPEERFPGQHEITIEHDGLMRTFIVDVPKTFDADRADAYSAVMVFHGLDAAADGMAHTGMSDAGEERDFISVYPSAVDGRWSIDATEDDFDDTGFVQAILKDLSENWNVDTGAVFAAGHSQGGSFVQHLADKLPDAFAGVSVVTGVKPNNLDGLNESGDDLPMVFFHSTEDPYLPYEGTPYGPNMVFGGADQTVQHWADYNDTEMGDFVVVPDIADDGQSTVMRVSEDGSIAHYVTDGDSHGWPGSDYWNDYTGEVTYDIDATEIMVEFFADYGL